MTFENPYLILADDPALPVYPIPAGETRLGRASANGIQVQHRNVSRHHLTLVYGGGEVRLCLRSKNPTRVDGERAREGQLLRDGQTITIGGRELLFRYPGQPAAVPAEAVAQEAVAQEAVEQEAVEQVEP